jgi:hypothetical protein
MVNSSVIVALVASIGFLLSVSALEISMAQNLTHNNLSKTTGNVSNATINNPFLNGRTPFGSAALP